MSKSPGAMARGDPLRLLVSYAMSTKGCTSREVSTGGGTTVVVAVEIRTENIKKWPTLYRRRTQPAFRIRRPAIIHYYCFTRYLLHNSVSPLYLPVRRFSVPQFLSLFVVHIAFDLL